MKGRSLRLLASWGLIALAALVRQGYGQQVLPPVSEAHRAAFAKVRAVKLIVEEDYDKTGEMPEVGVREALTKLLKAAGFEVIREGQADAEWAIRVSAEASSAAYPELETHRAKAETSLVMNSLPIVSLAWQETEQSLPLKARRVSDGPAWSLAEKCGARALLSLLVALNPDAFSSLLRADDELVRDSTFAVAEEWGAAAVPILTDALNDERLAVRLRAAQALGAIGGPAAPAAPALIEALADEEWLVRSSAAGALGSIGPAAAPAVPALIEALADEERDVRMHAARTLGYIGPAAQSALPALVNALKDTNEDTTVQMFAIQALGNISPMAVPALIETLKHEQPHVRELGARALGNMGPPAERAVPALIEALKDEEQWVCMSAAEALGAIGPAAETAVAPLEELLQDEHPPVRESARKALDRIRTVGQWWERTFAEPYPGDGTQVCKTWDFGRATITYKVALRETAGRNSFGWYQPAGTTKTEFHEAFSSTDPAGAEKTVAISGPFGLYVWPHTSDVDVDRPWYTEDELNEPQEIVRHAWVFQKPGGGWVVALEDRLGCDDYNDIIVTMDVKPAEAERGVPTLIAAPEYDYRDVHFGTDQAPVNTASASEALAPVFVQAPEDEDRHVWTAAVQPAQAIRPSTDWLSATPLIESPKDENREEPFRTDQAPVNTASASEALVPVFVQAPEHEDPHVWTAAVQPTQAIRPSTDWLSAASLIESPKDENREEPFRADQAPLPRESAPRAGLPPIIEALKDPDTVVRMRAAVALKKLGNAAVPMLCEALKDEEPDVRAIAAEALGDFGYMAVPLLVEVLVKDKEPTVRRQAACALGDIGSPAEVAVPALIEALNDEGPGVRFHAAQALGRMGPGAHAAVPALSEVLRDKDEELGTRRKVAQTLASMGPGAAAAVPALIDALNDGDQWIRRFAASALGRIGPAAEAAVAPLGKLLEDEDASVRDAAREALRKIRGEG